MSAADRENRRLGRRAASEDAVQLKGGLYRGTNPRQMETGRDGLIRFVGKFAEMSDRKRCGRAVFGLKMVRIMNVS